MLARYIGESLFEIPNSNFKIFGKKSMHETKYLPGSKYVKPICIFQRYQKETSVSHKKRFLRNCIVSFDLDRQSSIQKSWCMLFVLNIRVERVFPNFEVHILKLFTKSRLMLLLLFRTFWQTSLMSIRTLLNMTSFLQSQQRSRRQDVADPWSQRTSSLLEESPWFRDCLWIRVGHPFCRQVCLHHLRGGQLGFGFGHFHNGL